MICPSVVGTTGLATANAPLYGPKFWFGRESSMENVAGSPAMLVHVICTVEFPIQGWAALGVVMLSALMSGSTARTASMMNCILSGLHRGNGRGETERRS